MLEKKNQKYANAIRVYLKEKEGSVVVAETMFIEIVSLVIMCYLDDVQCENIIFGIDTNNTGGGGA